MNKKNTIELEIELDKNSIPAKITWKTNAPEQMREAKAFMLSLWDKEEDEAYKMDLWTSEMQKQEMLAFFQRSLLLMADTLQNATACSQTAEELRNLGKSFYQKGIDELSKKTST